MSKMKNDIYTANIQKLSICTMSEAGNLRAKAKIRGERNAREAEVSRLADAST